MAKIMVFITGLHDNYPSLIENLTSVINLVYIDILVETRKGLDVSEKTEDLNLLFEESKEANMSLIYCGITKNILEHILSSNNVDKETFFTSIR